MNKPSNHQHIKDALKRMLDIYSDGEGGICCRRQDLEDKLQHMMWQLEEERFRTQEVHDAFLFLCGERAKRKRFW